MRIISGDFKGRRIRTPKNLDVRPTTDMAKEALFNILNNQYYFDEISVLDLFAGSGSISYEFASRGSSSITAVDSNYTNLKFIKKTAEEFEMPITALRIDVFKYLETAGESFDIIFADPPYALEVEEFEKIAQLIFDNNLLKENGSLIIEHSKKTDLAHIPYYSYSKNYGGSVFSFFGK
ncbi:MAG: 16S rRNA (guanine(966)-N(2))-methyltransferase RsmD [Flavobacteriaceae bacterium]|nr:16S rRNA (guanine(966)-N(2))-methyltransferase RsmD [Flavobacteriaceae bacterium]